MDESSGSDDKNKKSDAPPDWELLSMSMTASDLKPALDSPKSGDNGVSDATLHSQYFAHPPDQAESAPQEIPQENASEAAVADTSEPMKIEIEQQILVSTLSPRSAPNLEFGDGREAEGFYTAEVTKIEGGAVVEEITEAVVIAPPAAKEEKSCSMKKRLQAVASKMNRTTALWSLAVVATVAGLIIIGSRWYYERLQYLEMMDLGGPAYNDEISEMAQEIVEANEALSVSVPEPTGEGVERQSGPSSFFASLRELW